MSKTLVSQLLVHSDESTKITLSILSTAMVDALGGPAEGKERLSYPFLTDMLPNDFFGVPPGSWTDDTSMTLCLAASIASRPGFDEIDQLERYGRWYEEGYLSSMEGRGFGIGLTTSQALAMYFKMSHATHEDILCAIKEEFGHECNAGNGSLMRVTPVPLAFWSLSDDRICEYARRSSASTHPNPLCIEACEFWSVLLATILRRAIGGEDWSKVDLFHWILNYPFEHPALRESLGIPSAFPLPHTEDPSEIERFCQEHHPILRLVASTKHTGHHPVPLPSKIDLPSSGYVIHTLQAALYFFFATTTFEQGALTAVNLGDDADTVGAVYAGLAGVWYGAPELMDSGGGLYWTDRVMTWRDSLVKANVVFDMAQELAGAAANVRLST